MTDALVGTVTDKAPIPVLVSVAVAVLDEPTGVAAKLGVDSVADCAWPVPVKEIDVAPPPLWLKVMVPGREPAADGVKVTAIVQVPFTARVVHAGLDWAYSVPPAVTDTLEKTRGAVPLLVTVTFCAALGEFTCWAANVKLAALKLALPCVPVADRLALTVPAPLVNESVPVRAVGNVGLNRTVTEQVPEAAKLVPQVVETNEKSVPVTEAAVGVVTLMAAMPVLVNVATAVLFEPI